MKRTKLECEFTQLKTEIESLEQEIQAKEKQIEMIEEERKTIEAEIETGNSILIQGDVEIREANAHMGILDKEVVGLQRMNHLKASVTTELHDRNDKITAELEGLAVRCEDLEDKVNEESKSRVKEKFEIDQELRR